MDTTRTIPVTPVTPVSPVSPGNAQIQGRRGEQQDAFGFGPFDDPASRAHAGYLAVLADGMGGMLDGGAAAREAVRAFLVRYAAKSPGEPVPAALAAALTTANQAVYDLALGSSRPGACGTTLVAAVIHRDQLHWVAAGDSRIYHYHAAGTRLEQLNTEHCYARTLEREVAAGRLTAEEIAFFPDRHALTSFLGLAEIPEVDRSREPLELAPGDRVLLCSDGVYQGLDDQRLAAVLARPPQAAADQIMAWLTAADLPGQDNATVAILGLEPDTPDPVTRASPRWRRPQPVFLAGLALAIALGLGYWLFCRHADCLPATGWSALWSGLTEGPEAGVTAPPAAGD
jgi:serine/threonine protein phosphatase PrpC